MTPDKPFDRIDQSFEKLIKGVARLGQPVETLTRRLGSIDQPSIGMSQALHLVGAAAGRLASLEQIVLEFKPAGQRKPNLTIV